MRLAILALLALASAARADDPTPADPFANRGRYEAKLLVRALLGVREHGPPLDFTAGEAHGGRLLLREPMPVALLGGTPAEIGQQHGALLARQIAIMRDRYLLRFLRDPAELARARAVAAELEPFMLERHRAELRALAEAAMLPYVDALLAQTFLDAYKVALCSTAAVDATRSSTGEPMLARNLDFPTLGIAHRASLLAVVRPTGYHAFASIGWPGMTGVLTGVNERGLAVAVMVLHEGTPYRPGMPYTLLFRTLLEEASTTDEALAILERTPRTTGNNLMICDRDGRLAVAELAVERVVVRRGSAGLVYSTNHTQRAEGDAPHTPSLAYPSSHQRYCALERLLVPHERITPDQLRESLRATALGLTNIHSMLIAPRSAKLWLSAGELPAAAGTFHEIDLAPWLAGK